MTDNLKELELAWDLAKDRAKEAMEAARLAKSRYREALFEATGFKGCAAAFTRKTYKTQTDIRFAVTGIALWSDNYITGRLIKKDGKLGEREVDCRIVDATNLGPWQPPA